MTLFPHLRIMSEVAAEHGLTLAELREDDKLPGRYLARVMAAKRLHAERKLHVRVIARLMRRNHTSITMLLDDNKRARRNAAKTKGSPNK